MSGTITRSQFRTELGMVLDALPQAALLLSTDRRVLAANRLYKATFGIEEADSQPPCYRLLHGQTQACKVAGQDCPLEVCGRTGRSFRTLHVHSSIQGSRHVDVLVRPITDEEGRIDSFLQILTPVEFASAEPSRSRLVGQSPAFNRMLGRIERVAPTDSPVLIEGEPGSGKETVARTIHTLSSRSDKAFVPIDCSSLREAVFEREAFGYVRGAFAGAHGNGVGLIGAAEGGTLFLDEICELPPALQARFLRLLETGLYRPEGSSAPVRADFRLICSSDRNLVALAEEGRFRRDLLLAISTFPIRIPPLRERLDDIPLLVESLLQRLDGLRRGRTVHPRTLEVLRDYDFPGNIRELGTLLERACLLADGDEIRPEHLQAGWSRPRGMH